jgi:hypothetical protein
VVECRREAIDRLLRRDLVEPSGGATDYRCARERVAILFARIGRLHVGLDDALRVLVVFAERRDARYERAATRFAARVMLKRRLGLAEARYVLALAEALPRAPDAIALLLHPCCG